VTDFHVDVVRLGKIEAHPNADALDITMVYGGYPCIIKKGSFKEGDLAVYIPVDTILPDRAEFAFLSEKERRRLRAKKLRGVFSMSLLVPVADDLPKEEGADVAELMGVKKWDPEVFAGKNMSYPKQLGGDCEPNPTHFEFVRYTDIEPLRRNATVLTAGEEVCLTEKAHGSDWRVVHDGTRLWVGSRTTIKKPPADGDDSTVWWRVAKQLNLEEKLAKFPGKIFFGELFGEKVQDLTYGVQGQTARFFDVYDTTPGSLGYLDHDTAFQMIADAGLETVPLLYRGPWDREALLPLCEGQTTIGGTHTREGFVVKPIKERWDHRVGRVILKMVGEGYLLRKSDK
jgi:RNA ligase (TIGR02306 family)